MIFLLLAALTGTVTTRDGRPVAHATVAASPFEHNLDTLTTRTNQARKYSFDLPEGDWVVYVDAEGYEMVIEAGRPGRRLDFRLEPVTPPKLSETYLVSARTTETPLLNEQYSQIERYFDQLIAESEARRPSRWKRDFASLERYLASVEPHRRRFVELMGGFPAEKTPLHPRREVIGSGAHYRTERVRLEAVPGVEVYGVLLTPARAGRRPALICQHGMGGSPAMTAGLTERDDYLRKFGAQAAERGYVVFVPYLVNDQAQRSRLHRKAVSVGTTLQILEQWKIARVTDFLATLPEVDPARIGMYGISWGGRTTLYAAAIDTAEECAFFPRFITEFSDADLASLVAPRPLFIESGTLDTAAYFKDSFIEYTGAREVYRRLGVEERLEFGLFRGLHLIHGIKAFEFLDRWLRP
jgi:dienelactone hydrolase